MMILLLIGAVAGFIMGIIGVGGGAIIISSLVLFAKFPQKMAQGTTLFIVAAPISLLAAFNYYKQGLTDIKAGLIIMVMFLIFSFIGAQMAFHLPNKLLKTMLGTVLILMGVKMIFF